MKEYEWVIQEMQKTGLVNDIEWVEVKFRRFLTPEENPHSSAELTRTSQWRYLGPGCLTSALECLISTLAMDGLENWRVYWENANVFYSTGRAEFFKERYRVAVQQKDHLDV